MYKNHNKISIDRNIYIEEVMQQSYEIINYLNENISLDIKFDFFNNTIWLNLKDLSKIFNINTQSIGKHIKNIYGDNKLSYSRTCSNMEQVQTEGNRKIVRNIKHYNLDILIELSKRIKTSMIESIMTFVSSTFENHQEVAKNSTKNYEIVKFIENDVQIDVNVDVNGDTIWLSVEDIAILFDRSMISFSCSSAVFVQVYIQFSGANSISIKTGISSGLYGSKINLSVVII